MAQTGSGLNRLRSHKCNADPGKRYFSFLNIRRRDTRAIISSSESLSLNGGMYSPFPFFIVSAISSSVCESCHSDLVRLGCPFDFQLGRPAPSLPWHAAHLLANSDTALSAGPVGLGVLKDKVTSLRQAEFDRRAMGPVPVARIGDHRNARSGKGALRLSHAGFKTRWCAWARSDKIASSDRPSARDRRGGLNETLSVGFVRT